MTETRRIACPSCGGTLPLPEGRTLVDCRYCGGRAKVYVEGHVPRIALRPLVDPVRLRDILTAYFVDPDTPQDMSRKATLRSSELFYVPLYEAQGIRGMIRLTKREARWTETDVQGGGVEDSVVGLNEFAFATRATRLPGWGLEHLDVAALRGADSPAEVVEFDAGRLAAEGTVLTADRPVEEALAELTPSLASDHDRVDDELIDRRLSLLYVPVWRVSYVYEGRLYVATIDAVTGTVLRARFPENTWFRVPYFLLSAAFVGWTAGVLARVTYRLLTGWDDAWATVFMSPLSVVVAVVMVIAIPLGFTAVLGASWKILRYHADVVVLGGRRFREWVGSPKRSVFDRLLERQLAGVNALFRGMTGREEE